MTPAERETPPTCQGCGLPEDHKHCPAHGTGAYMQAEHAAWGDPRKLLTLQQRRAEEAERGAAPEPAGRELPTTDWQNLGLLKVAADNDPGAELAVELSRVAHACVADGKMRHDVGLRLIQTIVSKGWRQADAGEGDEWREKYAGMKAALSEHATKLQQQFATTQAELAALRGAWVAGPPKEGERRLCEIKIAQEDTDKIETTWSVGTMRHGDLFADDGHVVEFGTFVVAHWTGPCPPAYAPPAESEVGK